MKRKIIVMDVKIQTREEISMGQKNSKSKSSLPGLDEIITQIVKKSSGYWLAFINSNDNTSGAHVLFQGYSETNQPITFSIDGIAQNGGIPLLKSQRSEPIYELYARKIDVNTITDRQYYSGGNSADDFGDKSVEGEVYIGVDSVTEYSAGSDGYNFSFNTDSATEWILKELRNLLRTV